MKELPKIPAEAKEVIKNKKTGQVYESKEAFDADVADPKTETKAEDFSQHVEITVAKLILQGKTKE